MVTKVILWVYNLKEISEDLLYWNKRQKKIFWTHCLFLMMVLTGCPGEEKTKTRKTTSNKTPTTNLKLWSDIYLIKVEVELILLSFKHVKVKYLI